MNDTPRDALSPDAVTRLLGTAARLRQAGDVARARALLRVLAAQRPDDARVWRALADLAENQEERLTALRHLVALARPGATPAPRSAAQQPAAPPRTAAATPTAAAIGGQEHAVAPEMAGARTPSGKSVSGAPQAAATTGPTLQPAGAAATPALERIAAPVRHRRTRLARRYNWIGLALVGVALIIFVVLLLSSNRFSSITARLTPTPPLAGIGVTGAPATPAPPTPADVDQAATAVPLPTMPPTVASPVVVPSPGATATPAPTVTPRPTLAPGTVVTRNAWTAALLRPDHAVALSGAIGVLQPRGRFVLALVAVGNGGTTAAAIPQDLFVLVDSRGNRYAPEPGASSVYLDTYGRGSHGDFSLEEAIPAGIGNVSVPIIFDVAADARGLMLLVDDSGAGWPVTGAP